MHEIKILLERKEIIISLSRETGLKELERHKENLNYIFEKKLFNISEGELHLHLNSAGKIDQWKMVLAGKREKRKNPELCFPS